MIATKKTLYPQQFGGELEFFFCDQAGKPLYSIDTGTKNGLLDTFYVFEKNANGLGKYFDIKKESLPSMVELVTHSTHASIDRLQDVILEGRFQTEEVAKKLGLVIRDAQHIPPEWKEEPCVERLGDYDYGNRLLKLLSLLEPGLDKHIATTGLHVHMSGVDNQVTFQLWQAFNKQLLNDKKDKEKYFLEYGMSEDRYSSRGKLVNIRARRSQLLDDLLLQADFLKWDERKIVGFYTRYLPLLSEQEIQKLHTFVIEGYHGSWISSLRIIAPATELCEILTLDSLRLEKYLSNRYAGGGDLSNAAAIAKDHTEIPLKKPACNIYTTERRTGDAGNEDVIRNSFRCLQENLAAL